MLDRPGVASGAGIDFRHRPAAAGSPQHGQSTTGAGEAGMDISGQIPAHE